MNMSIEVPQKACSYDYHSDICDDVKRAPAAPQKQLNLILTRPDLLLFGS